MASSSVPINQFLTVVSDPELRELAELDEVEAYLDRGLVVQIIDNLLSNAINYTPEGGAIDVTGAYLGFDPIGGGQTVDNCFKAMEQQADEQKSLPRRGSREPTHRIRAALDGSAPPKPRSPSLQNARSSSSEVTTFSSSS